TLVRLRFVPIPDALVNYAAALAGVRPSVFLSATAIGLAPAVALFTYFADTLSHAAAGDRSGVLLQLAAAFLALFLLTFLVPRWLQRRPRRE
ncbi:MAG TPA: VTT domain-containing protein, partial [Thermoanaerobaculia bacterium]|nr:VTT domain-containing protein [Thermoanaerobaculia bacterium]